MLIYLSYPVSTFDSASGLDYYILYLDQEHLVEKSFIKYKLSPSLKIIVDYKAPDYSKLILDRNPWTVYEEENREGFGW